LLDETGLGELEFATGDWRIRVARPAIPVLAQPVPIPTAAPAAEPQPVADHPGALKSPMVGIAYLTPDPNSPPFVSVGSVVAEGDTVMIIEAMKVMNSIPAHRSGTIKQILISANAPVEFGQILMVIE
jgi:acetyl-CoA carboxylase biotin carboxyl carrier protein